MKIQLVGGPRPGWIEVPNEIREFHVMLAPDSLVGWRSAGQPDAVVDIRTGVYRPGLVAHRFDPQTRRLIGTYGRFYWCGAE